MSVCVSVCLSVCRNRTCLNPILPHKSAAKKPVHSPSVTADQTSATCASKVKRVVERKSYRAMLSPDGEKVKRSAPELGTSKPGIDRTPKTIEMNNGRRRGHRLFGAKKFTSASASLKRLKHKSDRGSSSSDPPWKRRGDPWKKRRSLLAADRASGSSWSPRRVPSSSSLTSLSDTDGGKHTLGASQSRSLVKVGY